MKKLLMAAAAAAVLTFGFGAGPASAAGAAGNPSQYCTDNADFGLSHGECTSIVAGFFNKGKGANDAAALCRAIRAEDPDFFETAYGGKLGKFHFHLRKLLGAS